MFVQSITAFMIAFLLTAQNPVQNPPAAPPVQQNPAPPAAPSITVPAGTAVPLTLMNSIKSKSTKPGDSVRAGGGFSGYGGIAARHSHGNLRGGDRNPGEREGR
jgi:hypothetical protein